MGHQRSCVQAYRNDLGHPGVCRSLCPLPALRPPQKPLACLCITPPGTPPMGRCSPVSPPTFFCSCWSWHPECLLWTTPTKPDKLLMLLGESSFVSFLNSCLHLEGKKTKCRPPSVPVGPHETRGCAVSHLMNNGSLMHSQSPSGQTVHQEHCAPVTYSSYPQVLWKITTKSRSPPHRS